MTFEGACHVSDAIGDENRPCPQAEGSDGWLFMADSNFHFGQVAQLCVYTYDHLRMVRWVFAVNVKY